MTVTESAWQHGNGEWTIPITQTDGQVLQLRAVAEKYRTPEPEQIQTLRKKTKTGYVDLRYTSHATITQILNEIDPLWTFEFVTKDGFPLTDTRNETITAVGYLTLLGKRILAVGSCDAEKGDWLKELYGDCLVAGTLVTTARGDVPIEDVVVGDVVANRRGWFPVTDHWLSSSSAPVVKVTFDDGRSLVGTPHHRVPTQRGDVHLGDLVQGDELWGDQSPTLARSWSSTDAGTPVARMLRDESIGFTSGGMTAPTGVISIETSGSSTTVLCRTDITSITSTMTPSTTTSPISLSCLPPTMPVITGAPSPDTSGSATDAGSGTSSHGTGRGSVPHDASRGSDTPTDLFLPYRRFRRSSSSASSAVNRSSPTNRGRGSANLSASPVPALLREMVLNANANDVVASSPEDRMRDSVHPAISGAETPRVVRVEDAGTAEVWNLSVGFEHEYFANGIAVSNCLRNGAMRAGIHIALWAKDFPEADRKKREAKKQEFAASLSAARQGEMGAVIDKTVEADEKEPLSAEVDPHNADQPEPSGLDESAPPGPLAEPPDPLQDAAALVGKEMGGVLANPACGSQPDRFKQWEAVPGCGKPVEEVDNRVVRLTKTYLCNEDLEKWRASTGAAQKGE